MDTISYYFFYLSSHFNGYAPIIRITVLLIMVMAVLYLISLTRIFWTAYKLRQQKKRRDQVYDKYGEQLKTVLFCDDILSTQQVEQSLSIEAHKLKTWEKTYLTEMLVNMIKENK
ncbi:hypothetical protein ACYSNM_05840 [Myroides sp. LJL116]